MTELGAIFARLGLEQYLDSFIVEGFDTWETVLDIQEGDLDALSVKLGHRRKLQREIANQRGLFDERSLGSPTTEATGETWKSSDGSPPPVGHHDRPGAETKRKYRRHPKPDKHAPERPPSAYVIFSNMIREEVRGRNLSFTDIAKLVGDRWQKLSPDDREPFESQANASKERFNAELAQYKKTDFYCQYTQYIADFKATHSGNAPDGKRPKLEEDFRVVNAPSRTKELKVETRGKVSATHGRDILIGSGSSAPHLGNIPSPQGCSGTLPPPMMGSGGSPNLSRVSPCLTAISPTSRPDHCEKRFPPLVSLHASATTDPHQLRGDVPDLHSRTGQLSLSPLTNGVTLSMGDPRPSTRAPAAFPFPALQHHSSSLSSGAYSDSSGTPNAPPVTPADEPWRYPSGEGKGLGPEWPQVYNSLSAINSGTSFGQLPPLQQPCDRPFDKSRDPNQCSPPLPAHPYPRDLKVSSRGHGRNPSSMLPSASRTGSPSGSRDEGRSLLENSENDAANTLAVLACLGR